MEDKLMQLGLNGPGYVWVRPSDIQRVICAEPQPGRANSYTLVLRDGSTLDMFGSPGSLIKAMGGQFYAG